ncbi:hypothetical protein vBDshSR4C_025 [Dinoroseobacter phage vB_DshS-R4C]|nr:hypothetical protein vBDshSR4C_025 [Dinoroseobacter phage vB_DshS-R4C]
MTRTPRVTTRASYRHAVRWIAHEDNPGGGDSADDIAGYLTAHLVADLFGVASTDLVAQDVARERRKAGLVVREVSHHKEKDF